MQKKYFFFDIDGTLTDRNPGGEIPASTHETLRKLRENGHFVAIATGRSENMAHQFAKLCQIDNMVHDGGNGLSVNGKIVYIKPLDSIKAWKVVKECQVKKIPYCISINNSPNRYSDNDDIAKANPDMELFSSFHVLPIVDETTIPEIHKIFIGLYPGQEDQLESRGELGYSRYHDNHIIIEPDDKVQGIKDMMAYLQADYEDVVVFGDGHNDLTMMRSAPIAIAMGNAIDEVKEAATFVTKRSDEDGIYYACRYFGWIDDN